MDTIQVSFYTEQNRGMASWDTKKPQTILVFLIRGIIVVFVIKNQLFLKLWIFFSCSDYQLLGEVHSFPRQQTIFKCVIFLGIVSLSLEYM